jgi:hypothetical protein
VLQCTNQSRPSFARNHVPPRITDCGGDFVNPQNNRKETQTWTSPEHQENESVPASESL